MFQTFVRTRDLPGIKCVFKIQNIKVNRFTPYDLGVNMLFFYSIQFFPWLTPLSAATQ